MPIRPTKHRAMGCEYHYIIDNYVLSESSEGTMCYCGLWSPCSVRCGIGFQYRRCSVVTSNGEEDDDDESVGTSCWTHKLCYVRCGDSPS